MKYCRRCVMPDTRPGIKFNEYGVCYPCLNAQKAEKTDWKSRWKELEDLCNRHRRKDSKPDCIIPVSGGKDSHVQVYYLKEKFNMNPLLINMNNLSWTRTGWGNYMNLLNRFKCNCISLDVNYTVARKLIRKAFEELGSPTWYWDRILYTFPVRMAKNLGIPLIIWGENIAYTYGGPEAKEQASAKEQMKNDVVKPVDLEMWVGGGITDRDIEWCLDVSEDEMDDLEPVYLSYYIPWSGYKNMKMAKKFGFKTLDDTKEWHREGFIEQYDQIDSPGYLIHPQLKWPKFGHSRPTDVASNWIRDGLITRDYAIDLVKDNEGIIDRVALNDFCQFCGYSEKEFYKIYDKFYNRKIFKLEGKKWKLKNPIWEGG